ncbi:MAG: histidine phosphatase family protein, partial [Cucumibacter sp.]
MTSWPELYFLRHGQTDWNAEGRYQGSRDIPLNSIGQAQADANGPLLRMLMQRDGRAAADFGWFSSPLVRATETIERVLAAFESPHPDVTIDPRLIEISFGHFEGRLHRELADHPMLAPGSRDEAFWSFRPEGGENYDDLSSRIASFHSALTGPSVIVAHGGVLRVLRHLIEGAPRAEVVNWSTPQDVVYRFRDRHMS